MGFFRKNKKIFSAFLIGAFIVGGFFVFSENASAQTTSYTIEDYGAEVGLTTVDLKTLVINIIKWVLGIISLVAVSLLIYGGVLWMTSRGNEEKIAKAKKVIINTLIGMVIIILAWAIVLMVQEFITNATGDDTCCTPGDISADGCFRCTDFCTWVIIIPFPEGCGGLPPDAFYVRDVATSHEGEANNLEVSMCSRIQPIFNNNVEAYTVEEAVAHVLNPLEIVNTTADPDEAKSGTWETSSKSITFKHPKQCTVDDSYDCTDETDVSACETGGGTCELVLFEAFADYEVHLPNIIEDKDELPLTWNVYSPLYCKDSGDHVTCNFTTNDQIDTEPPRITSTYPVGPEGSNYPDRNVTREPIIDVNFSEGIDATTVVDTANPPQPNENNVILQQITEPEVGGVVVTVPSSNLEISEKDNGFRLSLVQPNVLEPFTWYRITVQNIEDLCGNALAELYVWEFQTNDLVAGFRSWYPTGTNECPDVRISVTFNTTMFNNLVSFVVNGQQLIMPAPSSFVRTCNEGSNAGSACSTNDNCPGGSCRVDYSVTTTFGTLRIVDTVPGDPATLDPDNRFRVYELIPSSLLSTNTDYTVEINTDRVIDSEGGTLEKDWTFHVTTADDCTCSPYISRLVPNEGGRGECITIQGYCFKGTDDHLAGPTAVNFNATPASLDASEENYIVTTTPDTFLLDDRPLVTVDLTYNETVYGTITSNPAEYWYRTEEQANGPCLFNITTDGGLCYPGTGATLTGIRFNEENADSRVTFANEGLEAPVFSWSDTFIRSQIPVTATASDDGDVNVHNDVGMSNGIFFDICEPPPGVPIVIDRWQTCDSACVNTAIGAQFNIDMNPDNLSIDNIFVFPCQNATCSSLDPAIAILNINYDNSSRIVNILNRDLLSVNTSYRVILSDNITSSEGGKLGNLNYNSDANETNDSYSWVFKTKDDPDLCGLASVNVVPDNHTAFVDDNINYFVYASGSPDDCDPSGQMLNPSFYDWIWSSSDITRATVTSKDSNTDGNIDQNQRVTAKGVTPLVNICAMAEGIQDCGNLVIEEAPEDPTYCETDEDCKWNELNERCWDSECLDNRCTPVFIVPPQEAGVRDKPFTPQDGAPGTWVSIAGCWFGNYIEEGDKSQVIFDADKPGELLPEYCGPSTWLNYRILREVPDDVTPGSQEEIIVKGGDSGDYNYLIYSPDQFTVNDLERPGICLLNPNEGYEEVTDVQIRGKNFGDSKEAGDRVLFRDEVEVTQYSSWADTTVLTTVPVGAQIGPGDVYLVNNLISSNYWPFRVLDPYCTTVCSDDSGCPVGQGCGYDNCCYDRPQIISTTPPDMEIDVCLNTAIEVVFNEDMDLSTLTQDNIRIDGPSINYTIAYPNRRTLRIYPDALLEGNMAYTITLNRNNVKSRRGVSIGPDGFSFSFQTADTDAACEISRLEIIPSYHMFTDSASPSHNFLAYASDSRGYHILPITNVYDWTWTWSSLDDTIVNVVPISTNDIQSATALKNGRTRIKVVAVAGEGWEGNREAYAETEVMFCDMPWNYEDDNICDVLPVDCSDYNFHLSYCRGNYGVCEGTNDVCTNDYQATCPIGETCCPLTSPICKFSSAVLPNLDLQAIRGQSGDVLKQYLFKESGRCTEGNAWCEGNINCPSGTCEQTSDGIGIRIYANPSNLSPSDWYQSNIENAGSPQSITVDGYQAVRDGRTIYVAATNYVPASGDDLAALFTNIYLISYNDGADSDTIKVFNHLVENWRFNTNSIPMGKEFIARDLIRLSDLAKITGYLNDYRLNKTASESVNLLQNPSLEDGISIPDGNWITSSEDHVNLDSGEKYDGDYSTHLTGENGVQQYIVQDIPTTLGKVYEVTGWIKSSTDGDATAFLLSQCRLPDNSNFEWDCMLDQPSEAITGNSGWVKRTVYVYADLANHLLRVGCSMNNGDSSDEIWCDNFSVRETDAPYPALEAGSYISNMSFSKWPSWQATLGNTLGKSLPIDPLNILINCPEDFTEQGACWDEIEKEFFCGSGSYIYAYKTNHGMDYTLYTNLETDTTYWDDNDSNDNVCSIPSSCDCFDYSVSSP